MTDTEALAREAIELAEKATDGPWVIDDRYPGHAYSSDATGSIVARCMGLGFEWVSRAESESEANARFIAFARTALPTLAREVIRLGEENERLRPGLYDDSEPAKAALAEIVADGSMTDGQRRAALSGLRGIEKAESDNAALREENAELNEAIKGWEAAERLWTEIRAGMESDNTALRARVERLETALGRIASWFGEFPETGKFWEDGTPMSYVAAYGSNGQRDFMRKIAAEALAPVSAGIEDIGG